MRKPELFLLIVFSACVNLSALAQNQSSKFKLLGQDKKNIQIEESFLDSKEIRPFENRINKIYGLAVDADIEFATDKSQVRFVLIDENFDEHLIFEAYPLLSGSNKMTIEESCEETALLDGVKPYALQVEVIDANVNLHKLTYANRSDISNIKKVQRESRQEQNMDKITRLNQHLKTKGKKWVAAPTSVSEMSYADRKKLFGQSTFPAGFEFYAGGVISAGESTTTSILKSAAASSPYIDEFDWRNRHGKNWISPVTNQGACGSCWAFASTGAVEAITNLYFNQQLNLDLSEQDVLSCSGAGSCSGGYPSIALDYMTSTGVVDEATFPYAQDDLSCSDKGSFPNERIKIGGRTSFGSTDYPRSEDNLKRMLIEMGPISGGLYDWSHAMVLVGYQVIKEGDYIYYRDLNLQRYWKEVPAGDPLIGTTVWIFKNSWGSYFGDEGYVYVETSITNIGWTHGLKTPVTSVVQTYNVVVEDNDGDGYYWWGLGPKPANCPECPDLADGNDADPTKGPLDEYGYCITLEGPVPGPVADFFATPSEIEEGESVTFTDVSLNFPNSWEWTFEGGNPASSTMKNPEVIYTDPGNYKVSLTVSNAGGSDTKSVEDYIVVNRIPTPPVANLSANITTINQGEEVKFSDNSTNSPSSWSWTFEGGNPAFSNLQNPLVKYNNPGTFNVYLTVTNTDGSDTKVRFEYITVNESSQPPVANFSADQTTLYSGNTVQFTDLSDNNPSEWYWEFPGGTPNYSTEQHPNITYNSLGTFNVTLTVTNSDGSDSKSNNNYINVDEQEVISYPPVATYTTSGNSIEAGQSVSFTDQSTNTPTSWSWIFEGGTPNSSTEQNPTITYLTAGVYDVSLTVTNDDGSDTKSVSNQITVNEVIDAPIADFTASSSEIYENDIVSFTDASTNNPDTWYWEFEGGDPSISEVQDPVVTYPSEGTYNVSLTVTNEGGLNTTTFEGFITVNRIPTPPVADFSTSDNSIEAGQSVSFTDQSTNSPTSWTWTISGSDVYTSTVQNPVVTFVAAGVYDVTLISSNNDGADTITVRSCITVSNPPAPVADFSANNTLITEGDEISFTDKSTNSPETWFWEFEGGEPATSNERNPKVTYKSPNSYKVSLTVTNKGGNNTKTIENYIQVEQAQPEYCVPSPVATNEWISQVQIGLVTYNSTPNGYTDNTGNVFELEGGLSHSINLVPDFNPRSKFEYWTVWIDYNSDFSFTDDEKVFSSSKSKSAISGTITLPAVTTTLTTRMRIAMGSVEPSACDFSVAGDVEDYTIQILPEQPKAPIADFAANVYTIYIGESIQFSDLSVNNPESYEWSFPGADTETSTTQNPTITYSTAGVYDVSLTVSKTGFDPSTKTKSQIITVKEVGDVTYCFPSNLNSAVNFINKVNVGSFSRTSAGEGYINYIAETINLVPGASYNVGLVPSNSSARNFWRIWIDFNNDGDFDDSDETLLTANNAKGSVNSAIAIPAYATGDVRMRITMKTGKSPASCDDGFEGEVEDYTVSFGGASASYGDKMAASSSPFEELDETFLKVYPNPTEQNVHVKLSMLGFDDSYAVYNASGSKIFESAITDLLSTIDLSRQPSGLYIVVINSQSNSYTEKIIKK